MRESSTAAAAVAGIAMQAVLRLRLSGSAASPTARASGTITAVTTNGTTRHGDVPRHAMARVA